MKRICVISAVVGLGILLMTAASADRHEAEGMKAAAHGIISAWNAGDVEAIAQYHHSKGTSYFPADGGLLSEFDAAYYKGAFAAGLKVNFQFRHLDIKTHGDTAVVTGYFVGAIIIPEGMGESQQGPWRSSSTWMKEDGKWKMLIAHTSALIAQ